MFVWLLTLGNLIFLSFEDINPSSILVILVGMDEYDALEGIYYEILGIPECLNELEKFISPSPQGYSTIWSIFYVLCFVGGTTLEKCDDSIK